MRTSKERGRQVWKSFGDECDLNEGRAFVEFKLRHRTAWKRKDRPQRELKFTSQEESFYELSHGP